jgi:methyl-accepting chemotaxis protein
MPETAATSKEIGEQLLVLNQRANSALSAMNSIDQTVKGIRESTEAVSSGVSTQIAAVEEIESQLARFRKLSKGISFSIQQTSQHSKSMVESIQTSSRITGNLAQQSSVAGESAKHLSLSADQLGYLLKQFQT